MRLFNVKLLFVLLLFFFSSYLLAIDECASNDDHYLFTTVDTDTTFSETMDRNDVLHYFFETSVGGILTISSDNANNKISLYGSENSCPIDTGTNITQLVYESNSAFDINVIAVANNDTSHTLTIEFTPAPVVSVDCNSNSLNEGNTSNTTVTCSIESDITPSNPLYLIANTINGSAFNAFYSPENGDYNASYETFNISQGGDAGKFSYSFDIIGDSKYENNETFSIRIINDPSYSTSGQLRTLPNDYNVTIINDDPIPALEISIRDFFQYEGDSNNSYLVPLYFTAPITQDTTIEYRFDANTTDSNDTNMTDGLNYFFTIPNGTEYGLHKLPLVGIKGDTDNELDENFTITLISTDFGNIDENIGIQKIINDDNGFGAGNPDYTLLKDVNTIDNDEWIDSSTYNHVIKTKVANKDTTMTVVYIDDTYTQTPYNDAQYVLAPLQVFLYRTDSTCTDDLPLSTSNEPVIANIPNGISSANITFTVAATAKKINRIKMQYADWSKIFDGISAASNCFNNSNMSANFNGLPQCLNALGSNSGLSQELMLAYPNIPITCLQTNLGGDAACDSNAYDASGSAGYIRPERYNHAYGCLACILDSVGADESCSSDNFAIRPNTFSSTIATDQIFNAGEETSLIFNANEFGGTGTLDYNETENTSFVVDVNISDSSKVCQDMSINFDPIVNFTNGAVDNNYTLNNVGDFNVTIHEVNASEYAMIDIDDTNDSLRFITPYTQTIKVIPHHLVIDGNLTNGSNGFTYLNNFESSSTLNPALDQNISAFLDFNITAVAENNTTTSNYTSSCYAKDGNITLGLTFSQSIPNLNQSLSKMLWYDNNNTTINGTTLIEGPYLLPNYTAARFQPGDNNGTGYFIYRLNFDRNLTKVTNPFVMTINDLNATDTDFVDANGTLDNNATYVYGSTFAGKQRYDTSTGIANIYYAIYCFNIVGGSSCNTSLLPSLTQTADSRWFVNTNHTKSSDGNITTTLVDEISPWTYVDEVLPISTTRDESIAHKSTVTLHYSGASYPYITTMENNASNWLIYNKDIPNASKNYFQVEFSKAGDWSGKHETNTTTNSIGNIKTHRRTRW